MANSEVFLDAPATAAADGDLANGQVHFWIDATNDEIENKGKDSAGDVINVTVGGGSGGGTPGGANTQVQFNSNGSFEGDTGFTYSASTDTLTIGDTLNVGELVNIGSTTGAAAPTGASGTANLNLNDLGDVDTTGFADGEVLTYNNSTGNWESQAAGGGSSLWTAGTGDDIYYNSGTPTVAIGTSDTTSLAGYSSASTSLKVAGDFTIHNYGVGVNAKSDIDFLRGNGTEASPTIVLDNDVLGSIRFGGHDGTDFENGAQILAAVNGSPGDSAADMPSQLEFHVADEGEEVQNTTDTPEMVITAGGIGMGTASPDDLLHLSNSTSPIMRFSDPDVTLPNYTGSSSLSTVSTSDAVGQIMQQVGSTAGGLEVHGYTAAGNNTETALTLVGTIGGNSPTGAAVEIAGQKHNGATNRTQLSGTEPILDIKSSAYGSNIVMRVQGNSNVGMGTSTPAGNLHIYNGSADAEFIIEGPEGDDSSLSLLTSGDAASQGDADTTHWTFTARGNAHTQTADREDLLIEYWDGTSWNNDYFFLEHDTGNLGLGTQTPSVRLDVTGDIEYTGTITDVSDERLKENIKPLDQYGDLIEKISAIDTYTFTMKDDEEGRIEFGVMAQELEKIFPELVRTAEDEMGTKSVNYTGLIAPMIEATKALKAENDNLRTELAAVKDGQEKMEADIKDSLASLNKQVELLNKATGQKVGKASLLPLGLPVGAHWLYLLFGLLGGAGLVVVFTRKKV